MAILIKTTLKGKTGATKDVFCNNFVFEHSADDPANRQEAIQRVVDFFNAEPPGTPDQVASYMSWNISRGANDFWLDVYDIGAQLGGGPLGSPLEHATSTLAGWPETQSLPNQVAAVLSLSADMTGDPETVPVPGEPDDRPRARKRGRIYLGPLSVRAVANGDGIGTPRLSQGFIDTLQLQADGLMGQQGFLAGRLCVWSRENAAIQPCVKITVDNSPDTQRRRKVASSARVVIAGA